MIRKDWKIAAFLALLAIVIITAYFTRTVSDNGLLDLSFNTGHKPSKEAVNPNGFKAIDQILPVNFENFDNTCERLFKETRYENFDFKDEYRELVEQMKARLQTIKDATKEGDSGGLREQSLLLHYLAQTPGVNTVCETGFNVGMSSAAFLSANPNITVFSFDIGLHPGTKPMAEFLRNIYGNRLNVFFGDSMTSVPEFHENNKDVKCDLLFIDGGHRGKVPLADIRNLLRMSISNKTIAVFDDYPTHWGMQKLAPEMGGAWELSLHWKLIKELFRCAFSGTLYNQWERGFSVGLVLTTSDHHLDSY